MFNIFFFLLILYLIYNYFNNTIKISGRSNTNDINKQIEIKNIDTCVDEVIRLTELNKICTKSQEYQDSLKLCKDIDFNSTKDKKKLVNHLNSGLFYKIRQNNIQKCPKEKPWVNNKDECLNWITIQEQSGKICKDDKYYKLAIKTCEKTNIHKFHNLHKKDGILYKLRDRYYKNKIKSCPKAIKSCSSLNKDICLSNTFKSRCKYINNKCKPWVFNNKEECLKILKKIPITKKQKKKIYDLCVANDFEKANYFAEIYTLKFSKIPFPKNNCKDQIDYLIKINDLDLEQQNKLKKLCKTKKGKSRIQQMLWEIIS